VKIDRRIETGRKMFADISKDLDNSGSLWLVRLIKINIIEANAIPQAK
jgi:hypothetical protein